MANAAFTDGLLGSSWGIVVQDDFTWMISPHLWTTTLTDSGSATVASGNGGIVPLVPSDGTVADNDEAYIATTNAVFALAANKNLMAEARLQFTEANTDDANVAFGLMSSVAANAIVDDGGGLRASGTVIGIYKIDGETVWRTVARVGSTVYTATSTTTAGGSSYQQLQIFVNELTSSTCVVTFKVDGAFLRDSTTGQTIRHNLAYSGASAMSLWAGVKNGGSNNETLNVDYLACGQNLNRM